MKIRTKLNEYNDTLLQVAKVCALSEPEKESVDELRRWLVDEEYGKEEIVHSERKAWEANYFSDGRRGPDDLVAVRTKQMEQAPFSAWASGGLLTLFHDTCGFKLSRSSTKGDPEAGPDIYNYKETSIQRYARYLVMILASLLPVVCIVVLHAVKSIGWRLGATAFFTAGFASALVIFTSAKEVEVFASTAAFAAVEVIFIGSALTRGNSTT